MKRINLPPTFLIKSAKLVKYETLGGNGKIPPHHKGDDNLGKKNTRESHFNS